MARKKNKRRQSPLKYMGGKSTLAPWIIDHFPAHRKYVEVFGGGASVLYQKPPSRTEILNDQYGHLVNFWRVLRDEPQALQQRLTLTPYSRDEHRRAQANMLAQVSAGDDVERAADLFTLLRQSYAGRLHSGWAYAKRQHVGETLGRVIDELGESAARLRGVGVERGDFAQILSRYDDADNLFYCDPPYQNETRNIAGDVCYCTTDKVCHRCQIYGHEMSLNDHIRFLDSVTKSAGMVVLSHPDTKLYQARLTGWFKYSKEVAYCAANTSNGVKHRVLEWLWLNPRAKSELDRLKFIDCPKTQIKPLTEMRIMTTTNRTVIETLTDKQDQLKLEVAKIEAELKQVQTALNSLGIKAQPLPEMAAAKPLPTPVKIKGKTVPYQKEELQKLYDLIPVGAENALEYRSICKGKLDWRRVRTQAFLYHFPDVKETDKKVYYLPAKSAVAVETN